MKRFERAKLLYARFQGRPHDALLRDNVERVIPPVVVKLGELIGLVYRSDKWSPGVPRNYIHFMDDPPELVSNPEGSRLYIIGGSYRVTARGIEG